MWHPLHRAREKPPIDTVWPARNRPRPSISASGAGALSPRSSPGRIFLWLDIGMLAVRLTRLKSKRLFFYPLSNAALVAGTCRLHQAPKLEC